MNQARPPRKLGKRIGLGLAIVGALVLVAWIRVEQLPRWRAHAADPGPVAAETIVRAHLRALEAGDWEAAKSFIAADYRAVGVIPFPVSLFVGIDADNALDMHVARRRALPDFRFNETYRISEPGHVRIEVQLTGTHTGVIDYRGVLRDIPVIEATGKSVALPSEYFDYWIRDGQIVLTEIDIPDDAGVAALVRAVSE